MVAVSASERLQSSRYSSIDRFVDCAFGRKLFFGGAGRPCYPRGDSIGSRVPGLIERDRAISVPWLSAVGGLRD